MFVTISPFARSLDVKLTVTRFRFLSFFASMMSTHFPSFPSRAGARPRTPNRNN
jgi:hypothetical protein